MTWTRGGFSQAVAAFIGTIAAHAVKITFVVFCLFLKLILTPPVEKIRLPRRLEFTSNSAPRLWRRLRALSQEIEMPLCWKCKYNSTKCSREIKDQSWSMAMFVTFYWVNRRKPKWTTEGSSLIRFDKEAREVTLQLQPGCRGGRIHKTFLILLHFARCK